MNNLAKCMTNKLELDLRAFARQLYNEQIAFLFKVPEDVQQTPCDFFGHTRFGRAILIECKMVKRRSLPLGAAGANGLQPHQWCALEQAHKTGAISLLLWQNGEDAALLNVPQIKLLAQGRKSIPWPGDQPLTWQRALWNLLVANNKLEGLSAHDRASTIETNVCHHQLDPKTTSNEVARGCPPHGDAT
jgi:hypothetical protein